MCLTKDKKYHPFNRPLVAKEDIVCYKKLNQIGENIYITPCTYIQVPIECIRDKVPFKAEILDKFMFIWRHVLGFSNIVTDGFIHTFSLSVSHRYLFCSGCVFRCIIPKGTKYFIGEGYDYASKQIIFVEQLK